MKFAIIGTGFIFRSHIQAISQVNGKIVDAVNEDNGKDAWKDMVKNTDADCIVVLTPNDLHFGMAKFSADCGKIVLCEKPLAINSEDIKKLSQYKNIFSVLQLRHHPVAKKLKEEITPKTDYKVKLDISVFRDEKYYKIWKGQKERSGGVLFNLGIHYFDMLLYLFGQPQEVKTTLLDEKTGQGIIRGENYDCEWKISTAAPKDSQRRVFEINGVQYNFSSKDNLAYENLHINVYEDLLGNKGVGPKEVLPSVELVETLYKSYEK